MAAKLKKGDKVVVLAGKDKGKTGEISSVAPKDNKAVVDGLNIAIRHTKQSAASQGGRLAKAMPIDLSNLALLDKTYARWSEETLDRMLSAGLKSVFWGVQAFLAHRDQTAPGNILNYSSPVAYRGRANTGAYTTIKAGIAGLTKVLAGELGRGGDVDDLGAVFEEVGIYDLGVGHWAGSFVIHVKVLMWK